MHYSKNVLVKIWGSNFYRHFFWKNTIFLGFFWNLEAKLRPFGEGVVIYIYIYIYILLIRFGKLLFFLRPPSLNKGGRGLHPSSSRSKNKPNFYNVGVNPSQVWVCRGMMDWELFWYWFNSVQTRCIVKGKAKKGLLFWRLSGEFWFSQERLFSRNSIRGTFIFNKITDFYKHPLTLRAKGALISEPRCSTPCEMQFFPREEGQPAFSRKTLDKGSFPFSRGEKSHLAGG